MNSRDRELIRQAIYRQWFDDNEEDPDTRVVPLLEDLTTATVLFVESGVKRAKYEKAIHHQRHIKNKTRVTLVLGDGSTRVYEDSPVVFDRSSLTLGWKVPALHGQSLVSGTATRRDGSGYRRESIEIAGLIHANPEYSIAMPAKDPWTIWE